MEEMEKLKRFSRVKLERRRNKASSRIIVVKGIRKIRILQ